RLVLVHEADRRPPGDAEEHLEDRPHAAPLARRHRRDAVADEPAAGREQRVVLLPALATDGVADDVDLAVAADERAHRRLDVAAGVDRMLHAALADELVLARRG